MSTSTLHIEALDSNILPAGVMLPFGGATAPDGWLLCSGQAVSRTTYARLFGAISTAWGSGDGSTTFNVPDLRGRALVGKDNMGGTAAGRVTTAGSGVDGATLGAVGGAETHTLTSAQMPSHTHSVGAVGGATASGTGGGQPFAGSGGGVSSGSAGSGGAHNNMPPSAVTNYIIKF